MSFDLASFGTAVPNTSGGFDYYENNARRFSTAKSVGREAQARPGAIDHTPGVDVIPVPAPGEVLLFSGAQLHTSIPNTSGLARYSVDFRTVDTRDLTAGRGAPLVDAHCTGTAIRDFVSIKDESALDEELVRSIYGPPPSGLAARLRRSGRPAAAISGANVPNYVSGPVPDDPVVRRAWPAGRLAAVRERSLNLKAVLSGQILRRLSWGVADQAVSSITNFAVSIYVARSLGAEQFGAFSLAYVTYPFVLNASRGLATDPLMVRFTAVDHRTWKRAVAQSSGLAAVVGIVSGLFVLAVAMLLDGYARMAFLALGLSLPGTDAAGQLAICVLLARTWGARVPQRHHLGRDSHSRPDPGAAQRARERVLVHARVGNVGYHRGSRRAVAGPRPSDVAWRPRLAGETPGPRNPLHGRGNGVQRGAAAPVLCGRRHSRPGRRRLRPGR